MTEAWTVLMAQMASAGELPKDGDAWAGAAMALVATGALVVWLAFKVACVCLSLWASVAFPHMSRATLDRYRLRPLMSAGVGLVNGIVGLFLALVMIQTKVLALLGILLLLALTTLALFGFGAAYTNLGDRLIGANGTTRRSAVRTHLLGGTVVELALLFPVLGQVLSVAVFFRGLGAAVLGFFARHQSHSVASGKDEMDRMGSMDETSL